MQKYIHIYLKHFFCNVAVILKTFIIHLLPIYHFANNLFPWKKRGKKDYIVKTASMYYL